MQDDVQDDELDRIKLRVQKIRSLEEPHSRIFRLRCAGDCMSYKAIGLELHYAEDTIREYLGRIYDTIGIDDSTPQAHRLIQLGKVYALMLQEDAARGLGSDDEHAEEAQARA